MVVVKIVAVMALTVMLASQMPGASTPASWTALSTAIAVDPFENVPQWPQFGQPAVNVSTGTLYARPTDYDPYEDDPPVPVCANSDTLSLTPGASASTYVIQPGTNACFAYPVSEISFQPGVWRTTVWAAASVSTVTLRHRLANLDSQDPSWWPEFRCEDTAEIATGAATDYEFLCDLALWNFVSNRVLVLMLRNMDSAGTITVHFNDPTVETNILPPEWSSSEVSDCSWNPLTWGGCLTGTIDWLGAGILYLGGVLWTVLNYVGMALAWVASIVISFFGAVLGIGDFVGSFMPPGLEFVGTAFSVIFIVLVLFVILSFIRGQDSA